MISLGVDLGSTGLRAAYSPKGEADRFIALTGVEWPWLLCESGARGPLPVSFPSLKSKLGVTARVRADERDVAPAEVLARALDTLCERVIAETGHGIGHAVISVPARFSSTQRGALLDAAGQAGLDSVSLITDSIAAVIGHTRSEETGTFLVYGMGYQGFELGLVRAVRDRYRVLSYEAAGSPSGATFDERILLGWLDVLRQHGTLPDEMVHGESGWEKLRAAAEQVKEQLAAGARRVMFPKFARGADGQSMTVQFGHEKFEELVRAEGAGTLDRLENLLGQSGLSREKVETVLLVGGSTRIPAIRELAAGLGATIATAGAEHIARGAALHAHRLSRRSPEAYEEPTGATGIEPARPLPKATPLAGTLLTAPGVAPPTGPDGTASLGRARHLLKQGRSDEAGGELRRLIAEAQGLLDEIAASHSPEARASSGRAGAPPGGNGAADLLARADLRLRRARYQEAINLAHMAWEREPSRPDVFDAMLDIHCAAAMANPVASKFSRDVTWLRCALSHDQSNTRIRGLLAARTYLHGKELHRTGRKDEARRTLQQALAWDPEHTDANDLLRQIGTRR